MTLVMVAGQPPALDFQCKRGRLCSDLARGNTHGPNNRIASAAVAGAKSHIG